MNKTFNEKDLVFLHKETGVKISFADIRFRKENIGDKIGIVKHIEFDKEPVFWSYSVDEIMFSNDFVKYLEEDRACIVERCYLCGRYELLEIGDSKTCECGNMIPF